MYGVWVFMATSGQGVNSQESNFEELSDEPEQYCTRYVIRLKWHVQLV